MEENTGTMPTVGQTQDSTNIPVEEKTFTKSQVNEMMQKRVERSHNSFFNRYGVKDLSELDALFGKASDYEIATQKYAELQPLYDDLVNQHKDLTKRYAYKTHNVNQDKVNDIETYFKGKGIDIDENTLAEELKTHPDWLTKVATVRPIGAEATPSNTVDEKTLAERYLGIKLR